LFLRFLDLESFSPAKSFRKWPRDHFDNVNEKLTLARRFDVGSPNNFSPKDFSQKDFSPNDFSPKYFSPNDLSKSFSPFLGKSRLGKRGLRKIRRTRAAASHPHEEQDIIGSNPSGVLVHTDTTQFFICI
jgi:hypothetical protein